MEISKGKVAAVGLVGAILAAMVAWTQLGFWVPASTDDLAAHNAANHAHFLLVEDDARQTKILTLALTRGNMEAQLDRLDNQLNKDPGNSELKRRRRETQRQIDGISMQINKLSK